MVGLAGGFLGPRLPRKPVSLCFLFLLLCDFVQVKQPYGWAFTIQCPSFFFSLCSLYFCFAQAEALRVGSNGGPARTAAGPRLRRAATHRTPGIGGLREGGTLRRRRSIQPWGGRWPLSFLPFPGGVRGHGNSPRFWTVSLYAGTRRFTFAAGPLGRGRRTSLGGRPKRY